LNILTFDIEDWFHILDHPSTRNEDSWLKFDSRIEENVERIMELLKSKNQAATFFCLGWICRKYPQMVRQISDSGHEIGCHSDMHTLIFEQDRDSFRTDLERSKKTIEDCTGQKVTSYRTPGFSITRETQWAFSVLAESGITCDSSVFPARRGHGGFPEIKLSTPFMIEAEGAEIMEFPVNVHTWMGRKIAFTGGGYFRLFPYRMIRHWSEKSPYMLSYFHPRDFDPGQPMLRDLPLFRKFKSYYGLKSCFAKFIRWTNEYSFTDLKTAMQHTDKSTLLKLRLPL
jgi:peptidoglycan-N-acetylglucosamine deacetylase